MKRKFTFLIAAAMMLLTMVATTGEMWGQTYTKATSITIGDVVLLVTEDANMELKEFSSTSTVYGIGQTYTTAPAGVYQFTVVAGSSNDTYAFKHGNSDYLNWSSGNSLNTNTSLSNNTSWNVTFDNNGNAILKNANDNTRQIWWNVSSPRFACYTGKTASNSYYSVQLYKQETSTVATPTISPVSGNFISSQEVTITCATDGATIYYTTNGNAPTTSSNAYSAPFTVTETTTVKAFAVKDGMTDSGIAEETYTQVNPTVATPTFTPSAGTYFETQNVSISCETEGATIYYTLDGTDPTTNSYVYSSAIEINENKTVKAFAVKQDYLDSEIASATYIISATVPGYNIDFESVASAYTDWTFNNMESHQTGNSNVTAHGGTYYGTTGGKGTASITTKEKVAYPSSLTCYVTKQSNNTTASTWYIQVSSNGSTWTDVETQSATSMDAGTWVEFTANLASYTDVFVRVYYSGSTAVRNIDDLTLSTTTPPSVAAPTFSPAAGTYPEAQTITISCTTEGSAIYYTTNGDTPTSESSLYTDPIIISETKTIKAIAIKNAESSYVAEATYTIVEALTTMDAIYTKALEVQGTETNVYVTFNNWVISGVNGSTAYLTDGTKGCLIYTSGGTGFAEGNILSGTVLCKIKLYSNAPELTTLTATTEGLTVTTGGTITPTTTTIVNLSAVNTGSVYTLNDLTYTYSTDMLSDGVNQIKLKNGLYNFSNNVTNNKKYHITGVFVLYNSEKQIYPRSAADIVLAADMSSTDFSGLTAFSYVVNNGPSVTQNVGIDGSDFAGNLTITASSDYEICTTENGTYTSSIEVEQEQGEIAETLYIRLKAGLATGEHNGTLTFTATNLTTIVENVAGAVTATQNYNVLLNDQITNGTISANPILAEAGATITLTATPDPCYQFVEWVTLPDNLTWTSANQFTMPAEDVLISATFSQITYTVKYSVNGNIEDDLEEYVNCGEEASLWDNDEVAILGVIPSGFTLLGWSTTEGSTETVSSFEPDADATLYAVLAGEATYNLVTNVSELSAGDVIVIAASGYNFAMSTTQNDNNRGRAAITKDGNNITWTNEANVCEFVLGAGTANDTWSFYDGGTTKGYLYAASSSKNYLRTESTLSGNSSWTISISNNIATITAQGTNTHNLMQYNNSSSIFSAYANAQDGISLYKKDAPSFNTITEVTGTTTIGDDIPATTCVIVENGAVLTFNGENQGTAANIIIADGGQLIHNGNVNATLKKNVAASPTWGSRGVSGWYTIASPVADMAVSCATTGDYDFFAFNEENTKWLNQKVAANNITNFEQGVGYLYANADATVIDYLGTLIGTETEVTKPLSYACENASYQGINLMGNPFSRNLVAGDIEIAGTPLTTYYTVEGGNELTAKTLATTPIKPGQGFMVQATASSQNLVFNPTSKDRSTAKVGYISIVAGNSEFTDNAFVQVGGGNTLRKMTLSDNSSVVYVMSDGKDYAAANIDALEGSMPVCFKANTLGSYTITIEAKDINADYLHLIDNFTGEDINLLLEPSYSFIASKGDRAERFTLVFRSNGSEGTTNDIFAFQNGSDIIVNGEGELQVFDVTGRMVATQHVNGVQTVNVPSQGVFIFKLNEKTQKIVVR